MRKIGRELATTNPALAGGGANVGPALSSLLSWSFLALLVQSRPGQDIIRGVGSAAGSEAGRGEAGRHRGREPVVARLLAVDLSQAMTFEVSDAKARDKVA